MCDLLVISRFDRQRLVAHSTAQIPVYMLVSTYPRPLELLLRGNDQLLGVMHSRPYGQQILNLNRRTSISTSYMQEQQVLNKS